MRPTILSRCLLAVGVAVAVQANAADVRINGFASIVGGTTLNEDPARTPAIGAGGPTSIPGNATFLADSATEGIYDDNIGFKPDSNYGIQITADLGSGLQAIGQLTGNGGEDFDTQVSWAYVTYELTSELTVQAGRQRIPLFFYSDFLDVGYAYHWIRVPQVLPASIVDTFEGAKLSWTPSGGDFDYRFEVFGGAGDEVVPTTAGNVEVQINELIGFTAKASNSWLQLRASFTNSQVSNNSPAFVDENNVQQGEDNAGDTIFAGLAAHATIGNGFVVTEYAYVDLEASGAVNNVSGLDEIEGWYISAGYSFGSVTPHITIGSHESTYEQAGAYADLGAGFQSVPGILFEGEAKEAYDSVTLGVRYDFHPSASLKIEYTGRRDESDENFRERAGFAGQGFGARNGVDVFAIGVDVLF